MAKKKGKKKGKREKGTPSLASQMAAAVVSEEQAWEDLLDEVEGLVRAEREILGDEGDLELALIYYLKARGELARARREGAWALQDIAFEVSGAQMKTASMRVERVVEKCQEMWG